MASIDSKDSDIKMVILTKTGMENHVWYSYKKYNGDDPAKIIEGMRIRFSKHWLAPHTQALQFYDRNDNLLDEYKR